MNLQVKFSNRFKNDLKLAKKQNKNIDKLFFIIEKLANLEKLDDKYRDHSLVGEYNGFRECHIEPDWLLIYYVENNTLTLKQVTDVIDGKRVLAPEDDIIAVKNAFEVYKKIELINPFSINDLEKYHGVMMQGLVEEVGKNIIFLLSSIIIGNLVFIPVNVLVPIHLPSYELP